MTTNCMSEINTLEDLRDFVHQTICDQNELVVGAFQFDERILVRGGKPCGLQFTLRGPRAVHFSAIWDVARGMVLFYDCSGDRSHQTYLIGSSTLRDELVVLARAPVSIAA